MLWQWTSSHPLLYRQTGIRFVVKITAQRGTQLRCKNWRAETLLRLLENNLENGENPDELVIYMSRAKAARDWKSFDQIVAALKNLEADQTLIVQSGKPIGTFRTHARAPMVIMANGNVVGRWASDENFLRYEQQGLTILPGMTAAAWQYIGSQGSFKELIKASPPPGSSTSAARSRAASF